MKSMWLLFQGTFHRRDVGGMSNWLKTTMARQIKTFVFAFRGLELLLRTQPNATLHLIATVLVLLLGVMTNRTRWEQVSLCFAVGLVWIAESFNTAIEFLTDLVSPEWRPLAGQVKDLSAAAVLLAAITALAVGLVVFL
jgi:diacylglycerol kinase